MSKQKKIMGMALVVLIISLVMVFLGSNFKTRELTVDGKKVTITQFFDTAWVNDGYSTKEFQNVKYVGITHKDHSLIAITNDNALKTLDKNFGTREFAVDGKNVTITQFFDTAWVNDGYSTKEFQNVKSVGITHKNHSLVILKNNNTVLTTAI